MHPERRCDNTVSILGGGPAGASAAIAARLSGSAVQIVEKSKFPRHKVCGEFLSPEIAQELDGLGVWDSFAALGPSRIRRMQLHFARRSKTCPLPEPAWGLSRYAFDAMLLERAVALGAELARESTGRPPRVIASGRSSDFRVAQEHPDTRHLDEPIDNPRRGSRLFGFKTHFTGPVDDAVELFFFNGCYVGVNVVEGGRTNVCGLGPENYLKKCAFDYDYVVRESPALATRLAPLQRDMKWITTGPLRYGQRFGSDTRGYLAGDALSFVDPFTGSGLLAAVKTGALAGAAAARNLSVDAYLRQCRASLGKPFEVAGIFRKAVESGWAEMLAGLIPGRMLFALTRPGK